MANPAQQFLFLRERSENLEIQGQFSLRTLTKWISLLINTCFLRLDFVFIAIKKLI